MTDIVERLRDACTGFDMRSQLLGEAADEIDSLRFELEMARTERDAARAEAQCAKAEGKETMSWSTQALPFNASIAKPGRR